MVMDELQKQRLAAYAAEDHAFGVYDDEAAVALVNVEWGNVEDLLEAEEYYHLIWTAYDSMQIEHE